MGDVMQVDLSGCTIAVVGGDEREQEISRLAATTGAVVRGYGFPMPVGGITGVSAADSAASAMDGARYALFPVPGISSDGTLYAPTAAAPVLPDTALLSRMQPGGAILLGMADDGLRAAAAATGITLHEYEDDTELMLLRGPAIVEGALRAAIENTPVTIHASAVGVVGYGNVGRLLARSLGLLGADVHVFARNPVQRADAFVVGCRPHRLDELEQHAESLAMLFCTVPAPVVPATVLERLPPGSLVMDLAAPPGGVNLDRARSLGHRTVWARGMGRRAPVTVGRSQWSGIVRRIADIQEERREG
ncbi:MAG: dipicolinate synthase subunit DpsA [Candidatus Dormibacteria bacterium]